MPQLETSVFLGTRACADYVNDQTERLTLFVAALELAGDQDGFPAGLEITDGHDPEVSFRNWFDGQMAETLMTRAVDGFLTYLAELLAMVYEANPNALPAEANIPVSLALELDDREELVRELAGRRVRRLARKSVDALNRPFKALQFPLYRTEAERKVLERAIARRDLFVHSRGIVDGVYLRRVGPSGAQVGERLTLKRSWAVDDAVVLAETAVRIDQAAVQGWEFDTVEIRLGSAELEE